MIIGNKTMEEKKNLTTVFDKLSDLKALFRFGEKIVPIIQNLVEFMKEIVPLLEGINISIADSTNKMPLAANQIADVTNATEMATTQILDLIDNISNALDLIEAGLLAEKTKQTRVTELVTALDAALAGNPEVHAQLQELKQLTGDQQMLENTIPLVESIKEDSYKITLSLQVQDITAQQLAAVNHLIGSVHNHLSSLVADIESSELHNEFGESGIEVPVGSVFDPNASYTKGGGRQDEIDALVRANNNI